VGAVECERPGGWLPHRVLETLVHDRQRIRLVLLSSSSSSSSSLLLLLLLLLHDFFPFSSFISFFFFFSLFLDFVSLFLSFVPLHLLLTLFAAGHEVPMYKPEAAFAMYEGYLNGTF
jgi:hypothetical protein